MSDIRDEAKALADAHGGTWGEHPDWPVKDWRYEIAANDTRLGYWEWVLKQMDAED